MSAVALSMDEIHVTSNRTSFVSQIDPMLMEKNQWELKCPSLCESVEPSNEKLGSIFFHPQTGRRIPR
jgi:hypothetical protein